MLKLPTSAERYAWLAENLNSIEGSGIVYCLTRRDYDNLSQFLNYNGISARAYYSRDGEEEQLDEQAEAVFMENKIKVLVATVKLGMGYDKSDVAFVVHYQRPSNIVSYYQQIGRAGRRMDKAYTFLMCGEEDDEVQDYFINTAFPTKHESNSIMRVMTDNAEKGISINGILKVLNIEYGRADKAVAFLKNEGYIVKDGPFTALHSMLTDTMRNIIMLLQTCAGSNSGK